MSALRRYEIQLPSQFNDGRPVPQHLITQTLHELQTRFGSISCETQVIHGLWQHRGETYRDNLGRIFVDVPDTPENREFFVQFKQTLRARFEQLDIWLTTYLIETI